MEESIEQNKAIETEQVVRKKLGGYRTMPFIIGDDHLIFIYYRTFF
jgi:hypothetical protein